VYSGFDFVTEAFTFENFGGAGVATQINPQVMQRMFGAEAVCVEGSDPCVLTPRANLWMRGTNKTLDQGRSEGFAVLSLMFHSGQLDPKDYGAENVADLTLDGNIALQEEFAYWAATQAVPDAAKADVRYLAADVMPFLAEALAEESEKHYRLAIAQRTEVGFARGHALTPIGYFKDNEREDTYWLRVYDNNFPSREQVLEVHPKANTWRYEVPGIDGTPIVYESTEEKPNYLYFAAIEDRLGALPAPFDEDSEYLAQTYSGVSIVASNEDGEETGIRDGEVIEAEGDWVRPAFSRCPRCGTAVAIVNQATLAKGFKPKRNIAVTAAGGVRSTASGDTHKASVQNYGLGFSSNLEADNPKVGDAATFGENGDVSYSSKNNEGGVTISSTRINGDGTRTTVTVTVEGSNGDVSVDLVNNEDGTTSVSVSGLPEGSDVNVTSTTQDGEGNSNTNSFDYTSNGEDSRATVNPGMENRVTLDTDPADAAICSNGMKDSSETDQDCGGSCGATCGLGKACLNDGDCAAGFCEGNLCADLDPDCDSGSQSPGETGVDCGGSICDACVATSGLDTPGCNTAADCDTAICVENKCRVKFPIYAEFDRLPDAGSSYWLVVNLDGRNKTVSIEPVDGTLRYKIGEAYSYEFVSAEACSPVVSTSQYAGPTAESPMRADGTLKIDCPEPNENRMIVKLNFYLNSLHLEENKQKLEGDPIKMALSVDGGPIQLIDIKKQHTDLGVYQNYWAIRVIQNPKRTDYKVGYTLGETKPIRAELDIGRYRFRDNEFTDAGYLFVARPDLKEVFFSVSKADYRNGVATCSDNRQNQDETGHDCGGTCGGCRANNTCLTTSDCASGLTCTGYVCRESGTCSDMTKNQDETDVDCGGSSCTARCDAGESCQASSDCDTASGYACVGSTCKIEVCNNNTKDMNESDVDCGGSSVCGACGDGKACTAGTDCASSTCIDNTCLPATCGNDTKDAGETDVDCGGTSSCPRCARAQFCLNTSDCGTGLFCVNNGCYPETCGNNMKDPDEVDVDCGTSCAFACQLGKSCNETADCTSGAVCSGNVCVPASCGNNMKDADESDIDCGGSSSCDRCVGGQSCTMDGDCVMGNLCVNSQCASPDCNNGTQDPGEADVDCGAVCVNKCGEDKMCGGDADCQAGLTRDNGTCKDASCSNNVKDPSEGDVDCGGSCATKCMIGQSCNQSADCAMGAACDNGTCSMNLCGDGTKNQDETDVDCGGMTCGACMAGQSCTLDSDCAGNDCVCGANSGNCSNASGTCGAGQYFIDQPVTDGTTASGTYTIPAGCTSLYVQAWGAAGGGDDFMGFASNLGGAGGYVEGTLTVAPGDVVTVWLGQGGSSGFTTQGAGSYLGTAANGGEGGFNSMGSDPGGGGGLTSVQITGSATQSFVVPAGAGASEFADGMSMSVMTTAGTTTAGYAGAVGSGNQGGGGAGDPGGAGENPGAYGTLPAGLTPYDSIEDPNTFNWVPGGTSNADYSRCQGANSIDAGAGSDFLGVGGDGCVVLRCVAP
jgi:hypothetical protein